MENTVKKSGFLLFTIDLAEKIFFAANTLILQGFFTFSFSDQFHSYKLEQLQRLIFIFLICFEIQKQFFFAHSHRFSTYTVFAGCFCSTSYSMSRLPLIFSCHIPLSLSSFPGIQRVLFIRNFFLDLLERKELHSIFRDLANAKEPRNSFLGKGYLSHLFF